MRRIRARLPLGPVMLDLAGPTLTEDDRRRLRHPAAGGVIPFTRNYESPGQLLALIEEIRALREPQLLIGVDHEGGRVQRFREGFSPLPPMRALGQHWDRDREAGRHAAHAAGYVIGAELAAHGLDFSFAPVLDLDYGASSVIGVYAANDGLASGAIAALKGHGVSPMPPVTGQDAELAGIQRVLAGDQYMTIYKPYAREAETAARMALAAATGQPYDAASYGEQIVEQTNALLK